MGNKQNTPTPSFQKQFIQPKKINNNQNEIETQFQKIFGIKDIPINLKPLTESIYMNRHIFGDFELENKENLKDRKYEDRITYLQQELLHLKSIIEDSKSRSRRESPVHNESSYQQPESNTIQESQSRVSLTYFESRQEEERL